jgi:long-subunit fatty acid transport protein
LESWTSAEFNYKFNKKFDFDIAQNLRLQKNSSQLERTFSQVGINFKPNKNFKFGIGYRFIWEQKSSSIQTEHRWNLDGAYKFEVGELSGQTRIRFQNGKEFPLSENFADKHLRLKLKLDYNIKNWKFDPEFSSEIFRAVGNESTKNFNKVRFTIGTDYKLHKKHSISIFYGLEKDLNETYPKATYLVGVGYKFTLKQKKNEE